MELDEEEPGGDIFRGRRTTVTYRVGAALFYQKLCAKRGASFNRYLFAFWGFFLVLQLQNWMFFFFVLASGRIVFDGIRQKFNLTAEGKAYV